MAATRERMNLKVTIGDQSEWLEKGLEQKRYDYPLQQDDLVIDIGSYMGEFKRGIVEKYGCEVREYDPLVNYALWMFDGTVNMGGAYYYTSMFEPSTAEYPCRDAVKELNGLNISLCKINIEGGEYELLRYLIQKRVHESMRFIQVQFHLIEGVDTEKLYESISQELSKTHQLDWQYRNVWESWSIKN